MNPLDELAAIDQRFNQDTLLQALQKQRQKPTPQPKKKTGRGGTLTSLISEGGALGGAATGAALGSVVPGIGTAIGGVVGGALGAFGGRLVENKVRDDRLGVGDAAKEGAISGVLGGPLKLLKYGGTAAKTARAGSSLEDALRAGAASADKRPLLTTQSAANNVVDTVAKTSGRGKLQDLANRALTSQYGTIGKPIARKTNPEETFGTLSSYGLTKPRDVETVSSAITGSNGILNKAVTKAAGQSGQVNVDGLRQVLDDALENNGVVGKDAKELKTMFDAQMKRLYGGPKGSLSTTANPNDVLDVMRTFEKRIAQKTGKGGNYRLATDSTVNQANALNLVVDDLRDRLEAGANIKNVLTPELRDRLVNLNPKNNQWRQFIDNNVMRAQSIQDLRSAQAPFVNARQIIDEADVNSMTFGGRLPQTAGGIKDALVGAVISPLKSPAARTAAKTLQSAADLGTPAKAPGVIGAGLTGIRPALQGQLAEGLVGAPPAPPQEPPAPIPEDVTQAFDTPLPQPVPQNNAGIFDPSMIEMNVQKIIANGGSIEDVSKYVSIAQALADFGGGRSELGATAAAQVASSSNALNTLDQLGELFNNAGGGAGKLGGALQNALAKTGMNGDVQTYNDLANSSVSQLAKAINGSGQVTDADARAIVSALPQITDSQTVAQTKLNALRQRILTSRQNTLLYNGAAQDQ